MQGRACVAYADCQHKLGQLDGAVESLESFLQLTHSQVTAGFKVVTQPHTSQGTKFIITKFTWFWTGQQAFLIKAASCAEHVALVKLG